MCEANHDTSALTQRALAALSRDFDGKGSLQDSAAIRFGMQGSAQELAKHAAELIHNALVVAKDPRPKLRAFVRRVGCCCFC